MPIATVISPLSVQQTKTKQFILNMNVYRNTHYQTLNKVKVNYTDWITPQVNQLPKLDRISVVYTLYPASLRLCDTTNICSIHSKFFLDSLVKLAVIPDDNYHHVIRETFQFGEVDRLNPRVEIAIYPVHSITKDIRMRITLNQAEIEQALRQYAVSQGIDIQGKQVEVSLTAGRGPNGFSAELNIQMKDCPDAEYQPCATEEIIPVESVVRSPEVHKTIGSMVEAPESVPAPAPWDAKSDSLFTDLS